MRMGTIGLALGLVIAAATTSHASTPAAIGDDPVSIDRPSAALYGATSSHGRHRHRPARPRRRRSRGTTITAVITATRTREGGKGRGGHDDGPNHT